MDSTLDFERLVERHSGELYRYLWRMFGDGPEAEDCLQDTFLRAYKAYGRLAEDSNVRAWLYKIATNTARTKLKQNGQKARQKAQLAVGDNGRERAGEARLEQEDLLAEVQAAVMGLPMKQRAALMMRKYQELGYEEIGEALKCSPESARANVYQALRKLRKQFAKR
ncbi:MAG: RNA polymerase sigma factor [Chlorobiales bacterium]|nr:RNA polymerase sigma factor [Chlorobiales bacterium]